LEDLAKNDKDCAKDVCNFIRKQTGDSGAKDISMTQQAVLKRLIQWSACAYIVGREFDFDEATEESLNDVGEWFDLLEKGTEQGEFADSSDRGTGLNPSRIISVSRWELHLCPCIVWLERMLTPLMTMKVLVSHPLGRNLGCVAGMMDTATRETGG
jgi:hypothetical protein